VSSTVEWGRQMNMKQQYRIERRLAGQDWQCVMVSKVPMSIASIGAPDQDDSSPYALRGLPGAELRTIYGDKTQSVHVWSPLYPRNPGNYEEGFIWGWKITERYDVELPEMPHDLALDLSMSGVA
jgi:hypothetical protein